MDIQTVRGVKNVLFGGEGFFNTVVTGPGKVLLQTMPINAVAGSIAPYIPSGRAKTDGQRRTAPGLFLRKGRNLPGLLTAKANCSPFRFKN